MNPISAFFVRNIIAVFFFYGLAFFAMGLALLLASRRTSEFRFALAIVPLALFGLLHGIHEWVEMFQKIGVLSNGYTPTVTHEVLRLILLVSSLVMLLAFGLILLNANKISSPRVWLPIAAMIGLWLLAVALIGFFRQPLPEELLAQADALARFSLGIPAALLGAWALMTQQRTFREHGMPQFGRDLVWAATALLLYGVVGQLFVRATSLFPTTIVNSTAFLQWFGIPIQLFRGLAAAVLAVFMIRALNAFELESQRRLDAANQAKLDAQAEALEVERRISHERERLNEDLRQTARELGLLLELSNLLARPMALQDRLNAVLQRLVDSLTFPNAGMILLAGPGAPRVHAVAGFPANQQAVPDSPHAAARQIGQRCTNSGLVICRHKDGTTLEMSLTDVLQQPQCPMIDSPVIAIGLPLVAPQQVIGSLVLAQAQPDPNETLSVEEIELLAGVARQLGLSIENARLSQEAQEREEMLAKLLEQVVAAQEAERQRIARELHDATGQSLTAIGLGLRGVEALLDQNGQGDTGDTRVINQIREIKSFSTQALGELRQIIADLRPSLLDDKGLAAALKWYVQAFDQRYSIRCTFVQEGSILRLPTNYETVMFRITQEALTNIAKHAQASHVTIKLETLPTHVRLIIEDNGLGFDPQKVGRAGATRTGGWGLLGMQERAALLGGQVEIDSAPGRGTRVCVTVPYTTELQNVANQAIAR